MAERVYEVVRIDSATSSTVEEEFADLEQAKALAQRLLEDDDSRPYEVWTAYGDGGAIEVVWREGWV